MTFRYTMDKSGVIDIVKSPAVQSILSELAEAKAAEANGICTRNYPKGATGEDYQAEVRTLSKTCVGVVYPDTPLGKLDRNKNHTLDAINH